jgi:rubrerythrin
MEFKSVNEILDFAIEKETEAAEFYRGLAMKMQQNYMKEVFQQFSEEEQGHKAKLLKVKEGKILLSSSEKVMDLQIGDHMIAVDLNVDTSHLTYQQALILAMKAEKEAYKLYHSLSQATDKTELKNLFQILAIEEAKHKLRFEIEYDDNILIED